MRSSPLVLLLLIGVQAVLNMEGGGALGPGAANHRSGQQQTAAGDRLSERHALQDKKSSHQRGRKAHRTPASPAQDRSSSVGHPDLDTPLDSSIPEVDPKLFSKRRYRSSPRVVFSDTAPSHSVWEGEEAGGGRMGGTRGGRVRRQAGKQKKYNESRGEFSVCDSIDVWLSNLTRATDIHDQEVIVLPSIKIGNESMKQFFFETTCRTASTLSGPPAAAGGRGQGGGRGAKAGGGSKSGCRGIDSRHWNSYCTNTHTYVRALTIFGKRTAWRLIRINAACVCVLSRKYWRH